MSKRAFQFIFILSCTLSTLTVAWGQAELDLSFNGTGKVTTDFSAGSDVAYDILIQSDDKIVAVGISNQGADPSTFALARYNTNGSLDTSFGVGGKVITDFDAGRGFEGAFAAVLQPDGKILATGYVRASFNGFGSFGVARYNTDGSLDATFGTGGKVITDVGPIMRAARAIAVGQDGKIVVAGDYWGPNQNPQTFIARFSANGSLEGTITDNDGTGNTDANIPLGVAIQPDGKILTVGYVSTGALSGDAKLLRYNADGSPDVTFGGGDGRLTLFTQSQIDFLEAVTVQPDGRIVAVGNQQPDFLVVRLNADGSPDATFGGGDGRATAFLGGGAYANSVVVRPNGKILVAGSASPNTTSFGVVYFNADGSLDTSFSSDGILYFSFDGGGTSGNGMALDSIGRIVLSGSWNDMFAIARLYTLDPFPVSVSGQATTPDGTPIRGARVGLTDQTGLTRWAITSNFGYFSFDDVPTGQTCNLFVRGSKTYIFESVDIALNEAATNLELIGTPREESKAPSGGAVTKKQPETDTWRDSHFDSLTIAKGAKRRHL